MSAEVRISSKNGLGYFSTVRGNDIHPVYDRNSESPALTVYSRPGGADVYTNQGVFHLPCFITNSDHLLSSMEFELATKKVEVTIRRNLI